MSSKVRVRFAPSPTGALHIGGVRTALFNYLFAKKHGGDFILRIEDTDQKRYVKGAEAYIVNSLAWLGFPFDEGPSKDGGFGPYRQSERKDIYKRYAMQLLAQGKAYYAFDTAEELDAHRKDHEAKGKTFIYNWHNREKLENSLKLDEASVQHRLENKDAFVIRFKTPKDRVLKMQDVVRGTIDIDCNTLDDKVLFKSDGMPTYHLANIVDDHLMQISHVIRGEEWLPSLALHILLYEAFEWKAPIFAHLPLIMKPVGKGKLSKRDGDKLGFPVFPIAWESSLGYREEGYFPEAVVNFLALLGWNAGDDKEIYSMSELIEAFSLERVNKSGARFDPEKNKWFNQKYLQTKDNKALAAAFQRYLDEKGVETDKDLEQIIEMIKERASFVKDFWQLGHYFFQAPKSYDAKASKKQWKEQTPTLMQAVIDLLQSQEDFKSAKIETAIKTYIQENGLGFGAVMAPLRLSLVGALQGPHVFDILEILGKEESIIRIEKAISQLS